MPEPAAPAKDDELSRVDQLSPADELSPVYAATYNHLGIILWGAEKVKRVLAQEVDWLERHPDFRIGWDHEVFTYDWLAENDPETLAAMREALERFRGRLGVGSCTYGQPLSMFIDGESNIRQLTCAMDTTEKRLGYGISVYIMSEHPFHAQLPQLLAGCGFKGVVMRTHFMMYGHNPEYDEPAGWWIGVDGSRILTVPTYVGQADGAPLHYHRIYGNTCTLDNRILTDAGSERCAMTLADFRRAFGERIRPLIATRADDPRARESLISAHEGDPAYRWILVEDILDIVREPRAEFRAEANDFVGRMPWGYCGNWMWNRCRDAEVRVETAERLAAIAHALGGDAREAEIEAAWKNLLVAQHHDIQICGLEDDARTYLGASLGAADGVITGSMATVAPRIGRGARWVVFNPLAWPRTEWVPLDGRAPAGRVVTIPALGFAAVSGEAEAAAKNAAARAAPKNAAAPPPFQWQREARSERLRRETYDPSAAGRKTRMEYEEVGCLTTPFYQVYTAPNGGIRLLTDRPSGEHILAPPKTSGTLSGVVNGSECESAGRASVRIEAERALISEEGKVGGIPYRSVWTFYAHTRRIDWHAEIELSGQWIGRPMTPVEDQPVDLDAKESRSHPGTVTGWNEHEYKLRLRFYPYHRPRVTGIRDLPFHAAETAHPYVQGIYWTAVSDGKIGLALFNRGLMGSVRESDGAFSSILAFSLPYIWHTRILRGTYRYDLGIYPFLGDWRAADLPRRAMEYNFPLVAHEETAARDPLGETWSCYQDLGDGGAVLSALFTKRGATYARYAEHRGQRAEVALQWMGKAAGLTCVDLREREQARLGRRARLGPWQVQTLKIET